MIDSLRYLGAVFLGCLMIAVGAMDICAQEVPLRAQAVEGLVDVWQAASPGWIPLEDQMTLMVGDQFRTGDGGRAVIWIAEWGGVLLKPETHVLLEALPSTSQSGVVCILQQGELDIEVREKPLNSRLQVRGSNVTLSSRSSEGIATLIHRESSQEATVQEGEFLIQQSGNTEVIISGVVDDANEGIVLLQQAPNPALILNVIQATRTIHLQSATSLPAFRAMMGLTDDILKVYMHEGTLVVNFQGNTAVLDSDDIATFLIPPDQEISLATRGSSSVQLEFRRSSFFVIADQGTIEVNEQEIYPGDCGFFLIKDPREPVLFEERRETPVVPPPPLDIPPSASPDRPVGSPILP